MCAESACGTETCTRRLYLHSAKNIQDTYVVSSSFFIGALALSQVSQFEKHLFLVARIGFKIIPHKLNHETRENCNFNTPELWIENNMKRFKLATFVTSVTGSLHYYGWVHTSPDLEKSAV